MPPPSGRESTVDSPQSTAPESTERRVDGETPSDGPWAVDSKLSTDDCRLSTFWSFHVVPEAALARVGKSLVQALLEFPGRVVAADLQQPVAGGHLDQGADVAAGADRDAEQRDRHLED